MNSHLHEAARLWVARDDATDSAVVGLPELGALDGALEENVSSVEWDHAIDEAPKSEGALFVASVLAFRTVDTERILAVLREGARSERRFREVESALGWIELTAPVIALLDQWKTHRDPMLRRLAIAGFSVHRIDPGAALTAAVCDPDLPLRTRAARAVWQLGRRDLVGLIPYDDPDQSTRFSACWAGALLAREPDAVAGVRRFAETGERYPDRAVQLASLCMEASAARDWQRTLPVRVAILGTWALADPCDLPWLLDQCEHPATARVAAEAISTITGLSPVPLPSSPPALERADLELPFPDPAHLRAAVAALGLPAGVRHRLGQPISDTLLRTHLRTARMRIRTLGATELALRTRTPLFEVRASTPHQLRRLALLD